MVVHVVVLAVDDGRFRGGVVGRIVVVCVWCFVNATGGNQAKNCESAEDEVTHDDLLG